MLTTVRELFAQLEKRGVVYCHWKSNLELDVALEGETDLDLLIRRSDAREFAEALIEVGFTAADTDPLPSASHYFAFDEPSGRLVHVHAYFSVITGESFAKNYHFPVESTLLEDTVDRDGVRIPNPRAELVVFALRMMLKHTSLAELAFLLRDWSRVVQEARWLSSPTAVEEAAALAEQDLAVVDAELFRAAVAALTAPASLFERVRLGRRVRRRLRGYSRHGAPSAMWTGLRKFVRLSLRRLTDGPQRMRLATGGGVIAFVGPEASGKSTVVDAVERWLARDLGVRRIHAGKPPSTFLSALPNLCFPLLRTLFPKHRPIQYEIRGAQPRESDTERQGGKPKQDAPLPLLLGARAVLLAFDRRSLLRRAFRNAANGSLVLCDRYPSVGRGAPDGPQHSEADTSAPGLRGRISRLEARMYREIPRPDLVVRLEVPLDVALSRNRSREKFEPEDYVRARHERSWKVRFEGVPVVEIRTDRPLPDVLAETKRAIWRHLQ